MAEFEKMSLESDNLVEDRIEQLKQLLPEVVTEGGIDFDKLRLVLGDEVVEGAERYAFTWPGKAKAIRQSQAPSMATLRPCPEESVNWHETENLYIEGDNLEVLKLLQNTYHGEINGIKLIYIDPPYNTGHDFVYKDKFGDTIENYREQAGLAGQSNATTDGSYHSNWCTMIYPRIKLGRELLCPTGLMFISISDIEVVNLRKICDEIFGPSNFVADLIWANKEGGGSSDSRLFRIKHEHILCYAKNVELAEIRGVSVSNEDRYKETDEYESYRGPYYLQKLGMGSIQYSASLDYPIQAPDGTAIMPSDNNHGKRACWRWSQAKLDWGIKEGFVVIKKDSQGVWTVYTKQYLNCDNEGNIIERTQRPMGVIEQFSSTQAAKLLDSMGLGRYFNYSKPVELVQYLIDRCIDEGVVLDFFAGSSSTAHAVLKKNLSSEAKLKFILIQLPEVLPSALSDNEEGFATLCDVGKERIRRAGAKIAAEVEEANRQLKLGEEPRKVPDIGFRVFKLDESGIERPRPGELVLDVVKPDRTEEDIVFEMMLKWGLPLTYPVERVEAAGYPCYSVACGELVCCMAKGLSMEVLDAIADMEPRRVLMLDRILDDTVKLNAVQAFKRVEEKTGREVELRTV